MGVVWVGLGQNLDLWVLVQEDKLTQWSFFCILVGFYVDCYDCTLWIYGFPYCYFSKDVPVRHLGVTQGGGWCTCSGGSFRSISGGDTVVGDGVVWGWGECGGIVGGGVVFPLRLVCVGKSAWSHVCRLGVVGIDGSVFEHCSLGLSCPISPLI